MAPQDSINLNTSAGICTSQNSNLTFSQNPTVLSTNASQPIATPIVNSILVNPITNTIMQPGAVQTTYTVTTTTTTTNVVTGSNQFGNPTVVQTVPITQSGATFDTYPTTTMVNGVPSTIVPSIDPMPK